MSTAILADLDTLGYNHDRHRRLAPPPRNETQSTLELDLETDATDVPPTTKAKSPKANTKTTARTTTGRGRPTATWRKDPITFEFPAKPQVLTLGQVMPDAFAGQGRCMVPRVQVNAEIAHELFALRAAEHNRRLRPSNVAKFKRLISEDQFDSTHQGLAFNTDGECADGQHRLKALIEVAEDNPDVTIVIDITYNAPVDHAKSYDGGANRTNVDRLQVAGVEQAGRVAPLIRLLYTYEEVRTQPRSWKEVPPMSQADLIDWAERYGVDLVESFEAVRKPINNAFRMLRAGKATVLNVAAVAYYLCREQWDDAPIDDFLDALAEPTRRIVDSPQRAFHNWVENNTQMKRTPQMFLAMFLIAYKDFCEGNERRQMKWLPSTGMPLPYTPSKTRK